MDRLKKRFVMLLVLVGLVLLGSSLVAEGPPTACADNCLLTYKTAVSACHGNPACLAAARAAAEACIDGCGF